MAVCTKCQQDKPAGDFYRRFRSCKECRKAQVRAYRAANYEKVIAYDRMRNSEPHRVEARLAYAKSERAKKMRRTIILAGIERDPEKRKARVLTGNAIRDGKLVRQPCEVCGETKVEAHHDDYSKPLEVRWLCHACHCAHHKRAPDAPVRAYRRHAHAL